MLVFEVVIFCISGISLLSASIIIITGMITSIKEDKFLKSKKKRKK